MSSFWRLAGMSYLEYLSIGTQSVRNCLKEPVRTQALERGAVHLRESVWSAGQQGEKIVVDSIFTKPLRKAAPPS